MSKKPRTFKVVIRLYKLILPHKLLFMQAIFWMILFAVTSNGVALLAHPVFGMIESKSLDVLNIIIYLSSVLLVMLAWSSYRSIYTSEKLRWRAVADMRLRLVDHLLGMHVGYFEDRRSGDLMSRVTNDVNSCQKTLRFLYGDIIKAPVQVLVGLIMMFIMSWQLSLLGIIFLPLIFVPMKRLGKGIKKSSKKSLEKMSDLTESMQQSFSGIKTVKSFNQEEQESVRFSKTNENFFTERMKVVSKRAISRMLQEFSTYLTTVTLLCFGAYLIVNNTFGLSQKELIAFMALAANLYKPLKRMVMAYNDVQESVPGAERIFEILDTPSAMVDGENVIEMDSFKSKVEFNNVSFAYDNEYVLRDISFEVKKGQVVAFVGHTGSGKSTVLDLLMRFYKPQKGDILIDNKNIDAFKHASLLSHIAFVAQDTFLFNTTIRDNIRYNKPDASEEEVVAAAKAANIYDFIISLEDKFDTVVGERGAKLSGGQIQRITIARAILKNSEILLLDEATSALDTKSERLVQEALTNLMQDRTTLVVAHRLSTISNADCIFVLDNGKIVENGNHQELIAKNGVYKKLYEMQSIGDSSNKEFIEAEN